MKHNRLSRLLVMVIVATITVSLAVVARADQSNKATPPVAHKSLAPETEWFMLTYPVATKSRSQASSDIIYNSMVDHTPAFYCAGTDYMLQPYTGEQASTQDHCDALAGTTPTGRQYWYNGHSGLDIAVTTNTPVYAAHAGYVYAVLDTGTAGYGKHVVLQDKENQQFYTLYGHLNTISAVYHSNVARGQLIGYSGNTGHSTGPHLHFGLYLNDHLDTAGNVLDPYGWYSQRPNNIGASVTDDKWAHGFASYSATEPSPTPSPEPPSPTDLNEGTVIGNTFIHVDRSRNGPHKVGLAPTSSGVHPIENWYVTGNYGAAGAPKSDVYYVGNIQCQDFEGGTYCISGGSSVYSYHFTDVPITHWAHRYIGWADSENILHGYNTDPPCDSSPCFKPNDPVSRQQFCKIVVLGLNIPINTSGGPHFSDVPTTNIFYSYIETAYNAGIISGYADGTFLPADNITRGQMSKIVANAGIWKGWLSATHDTGGPDYYDVDTSNAFYHYIEVLYDAGVIQYRREQDGGGNGGRFYTALNATRAEAAQFIHELVYAVSCPPPNSCP